ncbi:MAG: hypothetical protein ABIZ80_08190 [Bryobacteraceae bacterium]
MVYFHEEQPFRQSWLWTLLLGIFAVSIGGIWIANRDAGLGALFLLGPVAIWLYSIKMITEVGGDEVTIHFVWLWKARHIRFSEIRSVSPRQYNPITEYGGWGIRWSFGGRMAYNVSGNRGVQLELTDSRTVLIGSQRSDELASALTARMV